MADSGLFWDDNDDDDIRCWICFVSQKEEAEAAAAQTSAQSTSARPNLDQAAGPSSLLALTRQQSSSSITSYMSKKQQRKQKIWVRPCKCKSSLKFCHEECLLKWITQKQGPFERPIVKCPACAHPYAVVEEKDHILSLMVFVDKSADAAMPYISIGGLVLGVYILATTHGAYSIMAVCGTDMGSQILSEEGWGWRTWIGLPVIPFGLVGGAITQAEPLLPFLSLLLVGTSDMQLTFPPSPQITVILLPWARMLYRELWALGRVMYSKWQQSWRRRRLEAARRNGDEIELVDIDLGDDWNAGELDENAAAGRAVPAANNDGRPVVVVVPPARRSRQSVVIGALLFPTVCSLAGTLLSLFPWVRKSLPLPFHRNVLGGCLFILAHDLMRAWYNQRKKLRRLTRHIVEYKGE